MAARKLSQGAVAAAMEGLLRWMSPGEFQTRCFQNGEIRDILQEAMEGNIDTAALVDALTTVFEEEYLVEVIERAEETRQQLAEFIVDNAQMISQIEGVALKRLKWKPGSPNKKYRWLCKDCGTNRGLHYFPIEFCRSCGGQHIVRQITQDRMGYKYRKDRAINQ
jgi:rubrerythrin